MSLDSRGRICKLIRVPSVPYLDKEFGSCGMTWCLGVADSHDWWVMAVGQRVVGKGPCSCCLQRKLPEQDIAQGSYIALPLTLLVLLAGYNHDKVGNPETSRESGYVRERGPSQLGSNREGCPVLQK